ncbi:MAG: DUF177 domain-containing protein [Gammaproteobacteria bacterium]|nr:DUF177 domain-containing protein [Gammaproteobacteria bacterium]
MLAQKDFALLNQHLKSQPLQFTGFPRRGQNFFGPGFDLGGGGPYHARAMGNPLHERRTAADWAAASQLIDIAEKICGFEKLSAVVEADLAALDADRMPAAWRDTVVCGGLEFGFADAQRMLPSVRCEVRVAVDAVCQRCLEPFRLPLEVEAALLLLELEQTVEGFDAYEVWELEEPLLRPLDIVEELLIMALPFAAMHAKSAACKALSPQEEQSAVEMTTPFAALRERMAQDD